MICSKASLKHRIRNFTFGLTALLLGLFGLYLVSRSRVSLRFGNSEIPPGIGLYLPGSILLVLGGTVVIAGSLKPMKLSSRFCLVCGSNTNHFQADPRFKNGKKIGDSYICETCGQKYLVQVTPEPSVDGKDQDGATRNLE